MIIAKIVVMLRYLIHFSYTNHFILCCLHFAFIDEMRAVSFHYIHDQFCDGNHDSCYAKIFHSQGKITAQGKLLLQDTLQMMELSSKVKPEQAKFRERRVFLFEQIVIVSEEIEKRRNNLSNPGYIFKNSLKVGQWRRGGGMVRKESGREGGRARYEGGREESSRGRGKGETRKGGRRR